MKDRLILDLFSPELAAATGVKVARMDLGFLLVFSLTVLVGLRFMGALLSSALIIIPAATARHLTDRMAQFVLLACAASLVSVAAGFLVSTLILKTATVGPTIVIISVLLFVLSLYERSEASGSSGEPKGFNQTSRMTEVDYERTGIVTKKTRARG